MTVTIVVATGNDHKAEEFRRLLAPMGIKAVSQREAGVTGTAEETGATFEENARIKARAAAKASGEAAVGDDSGLCVDALGGAPGIYSARYAGPGAADADRIAKLLEELRDVPAPKRTAKFVCALCCVLPGGGEIAVRGECAGSIAAAPAGSDGFGYDPVFIESSTGKTFAELNGAEKDALSHRGRAMRLLAEKLAALSAPTAAETEKAQPPELSSRQRAALRAMANGIPSILQVGKAGVTAELLRQAGDALAARELIKGRVLETAPQSPREAAEALAGALSARVVQVIGSRFVLYRRNDKKPGIRI